MAPILAIAALNLAPAGGFGGGSSWLNQILCTYFALSFLFRFSVENWQQLLPAPTAQPMLLLDRMELGCFFSTGHTRCSDFSDLLISPRGESTECSNQSQAAIWFYHTRLPTNAPLVFLLFFLLPRLVDPNQRRFNRGNAYTGISERLAPGEIRNVAEKWDLVFEAYFKHGALPPKIGTILACLITFEG